MPSLTSADRRTAVEVANFERQDVFCTLKAGSEEANSSFSLAFRQGTTDLMGGNISIVDLEEALESLVTIGDVEVQPAHAIASEIRLYFRCTDYIAVKRILPVRFAIILMIILIDPSGTGFKISY